MSDSDYIYAPKNNTATKVYCQRIAVSAANSQTALAPSLASNGWLLLSAQGAAVDFTIDVAAGTLVKDATGSGTTVGYSLAAGESRRFYVALPGAAGFVTAIASGAGFLVICRAGSGRVQSP